MARTWLVRSSLCAIFVLFTLQLEVYGSKDAYLYSSDFEPHRTHSRIAIELLDSPDSHHLHKREAEQVRPPQDQPIHDNRSNQQVPVPTTSTVVRPITDSKANINNEAPPSEATHMTVTKKALDANLGVNGTGIRKNFTTVVPPTAVPKDVQPLQHNDDLIIVANQTDSDDGEISISKFAEEEDPVVFNKTLQELNITQMKNDTHIYYNSTFSVDPAIAEYYWVDLHKNRSDVQVNGLLSKSHRRAATVKLSFDFPFYGHILRNVTIATGGFLYMGDYVHSWLAATQYIAPLMANFDTSLSNDSYIKYVDNGTAFTVQWEKVSLQEKPEDGEFTFQATLFSSGDIVFVYKTVPLIIENIKDDHHPVKVGLSDAYIIDRTIFYIRRKTIYEYHNVQFSKEDIKNSTVIYLKALPTCLDNKDCHTCLSREIDNFQCAWCPSSNRCSNGLDRHRQDWLIKGCDRKQLINETQCSQPNSYDGYDHNDGHEFYYGSNNNHDGTNLDHLHPFNNVTQGNNTSDDSHNGILSAKPRNAEGSLQNNGKPSDSFSDTMQASRISQNARVLDPDGDVKMGASGIVTILFMVAVVAGLGVWVLYAYRNPHTTSGQILIRYRPSQWRWKRGEARYTAATIHM